LHILAVSLSSSGPITSGKVTLYPIELSFEAYTRVLSDMAMVRSLVFTIGLTAVFTLLAMLMTTMAAYPLSSTKLKGRSIFMYIIVFTMFFSGGLIPEYLIIKELGLLDTAAVLVLPGLISPFNMIIMITFFRST